MGRIISELDEQAKRVIEKLLRDTESGKIQWNKYIHPRTYNIHCKPSMQCTPNIDSYGFVLNAKRDKDFITIKEMSLMAKEHIVISRDYDSLWKLLMLIDKQEQELSKELEQFLKDYLKS
jgi:hypothetical protein